MRRLEKAATTDNIAEGIEHDTAARNKDLVYTVKLLDTINGPYSVLLDAPWGDGKTFFVRSIEETLKALNPKIKMDNEIKSKLDVVTNELDDVKTSFLPFYFNAWENDFVDDPLSALFASMALAFKKMGSTVERSMSSCITAVLDATLALTPFQINTTEIVKELNGKNLIEAYEERQSLREKIDELANESINGTADKLVIIIDELDRCRPDFAVRLLEQTKNLFQSKNIIIIISADSLQLAHAAAGLYGPGYDSQRFIERFFDQRLMLEAADARTVATGKEFVDDETYYDLFLTELVSSHELTIRNYMRVHEMIEAGRAYCKRNTQDSPALDVAKTLFIPLLIFIVRDDNELFRSITHGLNFDSLYEEGIKYSTFNTFLSKNVMRATRGKYFSVDVEVATEENCKQYARDVAIWLFSRNRNSTEYLDAYRRIGAPGEIDRSVFTSLRFF